MSRRVRLMWTYRIAGPAGALALAAVTMLISLFPPLPALPAPIKFAFMILMVMAIMVWSFTFAWLSARKEDEYTLTAAKYAWFWGGLIGLVCSVPVLAFLALGGLTMIDPDVFRPVYRPSRAAITASWPSREAEYALIIGYMLALAFQFLGFIVARIWWGMRRP